MDNELLPEEVVQMIESGQVSWTVVVDRIKKKLIAVDTLFYPAKENFLKNLENFYQSGADKIFSLASDCQSTLTQTSIAIINWLKLNPKLHPFIKHPLTGKTIWHLKCGLSRLLFPCKYNQPYNSIRDLFVRNSDAIEKQTDFSGVSVYNLLQYRKCNNT